MKLQKDETGTIRDRCYKRFDRGFSDAEIIAELGFKPRTVRDYRIKQKNQLIINTIRKTKENKSMLYGVFPEHRHEDNYGYDLPTYKWEELLPCERGIVIKRNHNKLKQLNYITE